MATMDERVGNQIRRLRDAADLSKTQLAARLTEAGLAQMHPTTISRIESGERAIRLSEAVTIASVLGTDVQSLLDYGGVDSLVKQARADINQNAKGLIGLREAVRGLLNRRAMLQYDIERLEAADLESIEDDAAREDAIAVLAQAKAAVERSWMKEVGSEIDEWEEAFENFMNGGD